MGEPATGASEITADYPEATVTLAVHSWEVVVSVLRLKDEYGHISAAADAIEWQMAHQPPEAEARVQNPEPGSGMAPNSPHLGEKTGPTNT